MSMFGPRSWFAWKLPGGSLVACDHIDEGASLLGALEKAGPGAVVVQLMSAEAVLDPANPDYHHVPCTKLVNTRTEGTWGLSPERAQLWDILAKHYFHAHEVEE
jgi:hypothetical protein